VTNIELKIIKMDPSSREILNLSLRKLEALFRDPKTHEIIKQTPEIETADGNKKIPM
tara:strand:+ start:235 stop:405 length:171 start_codon:yes stop_codon:yes gene_type:complete